MPPPRTDPESMRHEGAGESRLTELDCPPPREGRFWVLGTAPTPAGLSWGGVNGGAVCPGVRTRSPACGAQAGNRSQLHVEPGDPTAGQHWRGHSKRWGPLILEGRGRQLGSLGGIPGTRWAGPLNLLLCPPAQQPNLSGVVGRIFTAGGREINLSPDRSPGKCQQCTRCCPEPGITRAGLPGLGGAPGRNSPRKIPDS